MLVATTGLMVFSFVTGNPLGVYTGLTLAAHYGGMALFGVNKWREAGGEKLIKQGRPLPIVVKRTPQQYTF